MDVQYQEPITRSVNLPYKPLETTFARLFFIFLFLGVRIPANSLCRPIRTNDLDKHLSKKINDSKIT